MKVKNLTPSTLVILPNVKGILTVTEIRHLENNTYAVSFSGISAIELMNGDTEVKVI